MRLIGACRQGASWLRSDQSYVAALDCRTCQDQHGHRTDLRGFGQSAKPREGYDKVTMANDSHALVVSLGFKRVRLVGHDIGLMVAYAYPVQFSAEVTASYGRWAFGTPRLAREAQSPGIDRTQRASPRFVIGGPW